MEKSSRVRVLTWSLSGLVAFGLLGALVSGFDQSLAQALQLGHGSRFALLMERSLFEGHGLGGSDVGVLASVAAAVVYLLSHRVERLRHWRRDAGFVALGSLWLGTVLVQCGKWILARPRPYLVFSGEAQFHPWWSPVGHTLAEGRYAGSFPSGHTATLLGLLTIGWVLSRRGYRLWAWVWSGCVVVAALAMGVARTMMAKHWPSDSLLLIPLAVLFLRFLHDHFFLLPYRDATAQEPPLWELFLTARFTMAAASLSFSVVAFRAASGLDGWAVSGMGGAVATLVFGLWAWRGARKILSKLSLGGVRK